MDLLPVLIQVSFCVKLTSSLLINIDGK
jgi:hypothetical protein